MMRVDERRDPWVEDHAARYGWSTRRHAAYPTTDIPWHILPESWDILNHTFALMVGSDY